MSQQLPLKVCILVESLSRGGAEKSASILSRSLVLNGYRVLIISLKDEIDYRHSGNLLNLGLGNSKNRRFKQVQKFFKLRRGLKNYKPDVVIDFRTRSRVFIEALLHLFIFPQKKMIYTVHSSKIDWHLPKGSFFKHYYSQGKIVGVSREICNVLKSKYSFKKVYYIPNGIDIESILISSQEALAQEGEFIVAVGRLYNEIKQFDKLIEVYADSSLLEKGVKLIIVGDGPDKNELIQLTEKLNVKACVIFTGLIENPYKYMKRARFQVLASKLEGFPMVILESLALGTPVVSFDCETGPSEVILNGVNGFLVENQNFERLQETMEKLINDKSLLEKLSFQAPKSIGNYHMEENIKLWKQVLN